MICVSIGRSRHKMVIAEHRHMVEQGARMVEIRLDYIRGDVNIRRLLADRPCPVLLSCRRQSDGGRFTLGESERLMLLRTAIAEGADYVDLEEDIAASVPRFGKTKRVISFHDFRKTPDDIEDLHRRMCRFDPDVIKICTMANHPHDNVRMLELVRDAQVPTVGLCMGDIGVPTRVLTGRYGAPFTFAAFSGERTLAPGQLTYQEMANLYHYDRINADTEVYAVIADPIGHSLSPLIHNTAFAALGLNKVYLPMRVSREDVRSLLDDAPRLNLKGLSVTIPHKEIVLEMLTKSDGVVRGIGACNTIVFDQGERVGYNTDYRAAMESLEEALGPHRPEPSEQAILHGKTALVLGAGGVGKAIAYGLIRRGATVVLSDGQPAVADRLAKRLGCRTIEWSKRHMIAPDILFNGTPIGMHPNVDESPFPKHHLRPAMIVFDAVYNPETTLLVKEARSRNCRVITGVDMFVRQARLQFKLFTGLDGPEDVMRDVMRRAIAAAKY